MVPFIFFEGIVEPPSESGALRALLLVSKQEFILEAKRENKDMYFHWLKRTHLWDFVNEIVCPHEQVYGYRISVTEKKQPCLIIDRVSWDNVHQIIDKVT
jgi:hypothetical protein|tara:strand:+ start:2459 stop:2758 length:300 start_codon:yes stop_codon:yes gene_type:complete